MTTTITKITTTTLGWQDGSAGKGACYHIWQPEFHPGTHMVGGKNHFLNMDKLSFDVHILTVACSPSQMLKTKAILMDI